MTATQAMHMQHSGLPHYATRAGLTASYNQQILWLQLHSVQGYCPGSSKSQLSDTFGHSCSDGSVVASSQCSVLKQRNHTTALSNW